MPEKTIEAELIDLPVELSVFDPVAAAIEKAKEENEKAVFDYDDAKGNKDARSHIFRLRQLKTPITEIHKTAKAEALRFTKALDAKKRELLGAVEEMIEVHHAPIKLIEDREAKEAESERIALELKKEAEEEAARLELEAREQAVREEREKLEREKEEIAQKEREAQIAEEARKQAEEDAENRRLADIQKEKNKAEAYIICKERELERERKQAEEDKKLMAEAEEARRQDATNRNKVHTAIYNALIDNVFLSPTDAKFTGVAIRDGKIPHVRIEYWYD